MIWGNLIDRVSLLQPALTDTQTKIKERKHEMRFLRNWVMGLEVPEQSRSFEHKPPIEKMVVELARMKEKAENLNLFQ
jgi:hypothetical protein